MNFFRISKLVDKYCDGKVRNRILVKAEVQSNLKTRENNKVASLLFLNIFFLAS